MKAIAMLFVVLALLLSACAGSAPPAPPAQQVVQVVVTATPKAAVGATTKSQPGVDSTVTDAQGILRKYGFDQYAYDARGFEDCSTQWCIANYLGESPDFVGIQLFVENNRLQGIVVGGYGSPSDSQIDALGAATAEVMYGPLGGDWSAVDCITSIQLGDSATCSNVAAFTELTDDGFLAVYINTDR